jgi:hypothetical protein
MARNEKSGRLTPYARELLENDYVRENLRDGVTKLQAAYQRARKRRVEPTRDERFRRQVSSGAQSLAEAGRALRSRRRGPERRWRTRVLVIAGLGAAAATAAFWARNRLGEEAVAPAPSTAASEGDGAEAVPEAAAA